MPRFCATWSVHGTWTRSLFRPNQVVKAFRTKVPNMTGCWAQCEVVTREGRRRSSIDSVGVVGVDVEGVFEVVDMELDLGCGLRCPNRWWRVGPSSMNLRVRV